jgi:hypothetical protein
MSKYEREKGAAFENEICALLRDQLGTAVRRNLAQSRSGTVEGGDIVIGPYSLECKRRAKFVGHAWLAQARKDCLGRYPIVVTRGDGQQPIAILDFAVLIPLIQGEL